MGVLTRARKGQNPMRFLLTVVVIAWLNVLTGVVTFADQAVVTSTPAACVPYTTPIILNGVAREGVGHACQQADGSWRVLHDVVVPAAASAGQSIPSAPACRERYEDCDRSCDNNGILGSRHVHPDCS